MKILVSINFVNTCKDDTKYLSKRLSGLSLLKHRMLLASVVATKPRSLCMEIYNLSAVF